MRLARSLATLGIAAGGIVALVSGVAVLATVGDRTIPALFVLFIGGAALTAASIVTFLVTDLRRVADMADDTTRSNEPE